MQGKDGRFAQALTLALHWSRLVTWVCIPLKKIHLCKGEPDTLVACCLKYINTFSVLLKLSYQRPLFLPLLIFNLTPLYTPQKSSNIVLIKRLKLFQMSLKWPPEGEEPLDYSVYPSRRKARFSLYLDTGVHTIPDLSYLQQWRSELCCWAKLGLIQYKLNWLVLLRLWVYILIY